MSIATEIQRLRSAKADIKTAIENKGVTVGDGTIDTYAQKISEISGGGSGDYDQGYEDGKNSVVQIDRLVKNCSFPSLNVFGKAEVELNFDNMTGFINLFQITDKAYTNKTVEHLTINCPNYVSSIQQILYCHSTASDYILKRVTLNFDTQKCINFANAFTCQRALEVIDGQPLNYSSVTNANYMNGFNNCGALVEVRIVSNTIKLSISFANCSLLSHETIQSIIDGLADLTGSTAQTLTLHKDVGNKLTETQKATITAKNWTLVY